MDFATEVTQLKSVPPANNRIDWIIGQMGDEGEQVLAALRDPSVPPIAIFKVLRSRGFDISDRAVATRCRKERA